MEDFESVVSTPGAWEYSAEYTRRYPASMELPERLEGFQSVVNTPGARQYNTEHSRWSPIDGRRPEGIWCVLMVLGSTGAFLKVPVSSGCTGSPPEVSD